MAPNAGRQVEPCSIATLETRRLGGSSLGEPISVLPGIKMVPRDGYVTPAGAQAGKVAGSPLWCTSRHGGGPPSGALPPLTDFHSNEKKGNPASDI